ncbi:copper chaperone PCu(A)C [Pseudomonas sp. S2_C03]
MSSANYRTNIFQCIRQIALALSLFGLSCQVSAQTHVENAWVRATVPGQQATGAFMTITASSNSKLLSAQSSIAKIVQIHQSTIKNDVMRMQPVEFIALPAGKTVILDPHNYHIMLIDLVKQVENGDKVLLTLTIETDQGDRESIKVEATARALNLADDAK